MTVIFGPLFAVKWAWPPRAPLMIWGLQTRAKIWLNGWTFWANHYLKIFKVKGEPPQGGIRPIFFIGKINFEIMVGRPNQLSGSTFREAFEALNHLKP